MPLPVVPDNFTARLFLDYTSMGKVHTLKLHMGSTAAPGNMTSMADNLANVLSIRMLTSDSVFAARMSEAGQDHSFPLPFEAVPGAVTLAGNVWEQDPQSAFYSIPGRSFSTGRPALFVYFCPVRTSVWPADNRYNEGEEPVIDTFRLNVTNLLAIGNLTGVHAVTRDGTAPNWAQYVNIASHSYWQRKQRRTGG